MQIAIVAGFTFPRLIDASSYLAKNTLTIPSAERVFESAPLPKSLLLTLSKAADFSVGAWPFYWNQRKMSKMAKFRGFERTKKSANL